jgi:hypothetical protein
LARRHIAFGGFLMAFWFYRQEHQGISMKKAALRPAIIATLGGILGFVSGVARADVTIERTMSVEGAGAMAFGNMSGTTRTIISGDKSRTDSDVKMQSKLIGFLARNAVGPSADIVRLDQDKIDHLNLSKKEYTETTFEQMRAQLQKATDQMEQKSQGSQPSAVDQSKCEWLPAKVSVSRTGEKAQFAGYDSERVTITASQPCQDKETGSICEVAVVLDQWISADFAESAEVRKFYSAYATKMGLDAASLQDVFQRAKLMFSQYKGLWTELATKMQNVKGYPVKTSFTLALGGAQCKDPKAQQTQQSQSNDSDDNSASPGGLAGAVAGKLGGLFHKKQADAPPQDAPPAASALPVAVPAGDVALMTVASQLVSISTSSASPDAFVVPADFKQLENKMQ